MKCLSFLLRSTLFSGALLAAAATAQAEPIAYVNEDVLINSNLTAGSDFIPDNLGDIITTTGRITSIDFRSGFDPNSGDAFDPPFVEIYLQEAGTTEATRLFFPQSFEPSFDSSTLAIGDEYRIEFAEIIQVHGVASLEVLAPSFDLVNTGAGNAPIAPTSATLATLLAAPEDYEGVLVTVTNVTITGGQAWPDRNGSSSVDISDGSSDTVLRIDSDTNIDGQPEPIAPFTLTGIFTQFDPTDPFDSGYQILPRFYTDIVQSGVPAASPPSLVLTPDTTISVAPGNDVDIDLFGTDTNATDTLVFGNIAGPGGSFSSTGDREAVFTWTATGEGTTNTFTFTVSDGTLSDTQSVDVVVLPQTLSDIILNEFQADPDTTIAGDANKDGIRDFAQDEFVEIVNRNATNDQDIGDWVLRVGTNELFTFPSGTILTAETAAVVFGGATNALSAADFGNAQVFLPQAPGTPGNDTRWSGLSNSGSAGGINLTATDGTPVFNFEYGGTAANNQSRNLDPDLTGTGYADHSTISGSGGALFSPGTYVNGSPFPGSGVTNSPPEFDLVDDFAVRIGQASVTTVSASDIDGNPISITVSNAPATAVLNDAGDGTATLSYTGQVADAGTDFNLVFTASDGLLETTLDVTLFVPAVQYSGLIINEYMPDPNAGSTEIDSNNDGVLDGIEDEFIEVVNTTPGSVDLAGCTLDDGVGLRHTFSTLVLPTGGAVVVFGGGSLTNFTASPAQLASTGTLGLSNGGDVISLYDPSDGLLDRVSYADPGVPDAASLNRDPDVTGDTFSIHSTITGSGGAAASPGTRVNGTPFLTDQPPSIVIDGPTLFEVGTSGELFVAASEPDGDLVTLSGTNLPANSTFPGTSGTGSAASTFTFTPDGTQTGTVTATFVASDVDGAVTNVITLTVIEGTPNAWDFESGQQGWTIFSLASNADWELASGTGAEGSSAYWTINGFNADVACDDWLISPALDLTGFSSPALTFWIQRGFDGIPENRQFLVSTNYVGSGDPSLATWELTALPDPGNADWPAPPQSVDLSAYVASSDAYVAFRYESNGPFTDQHDWSVDQVRLVETQNTPPVLAVPGPQTVSAGDTVSFEVTATESDGDTITLTQQNKPAAATFTDTGTGTGVFEWVTTLADTGSVTVTFIASDPDGADTNTVEITVLGPNTQPCGLIFSEYIEGSSNNKALELYNGTDADIDLLAGDYVIVRYNNGATTPSDTYVLTGVVASAGTYIVANPSADPSILAIADQTGSATFYNGDDAIVLYSGGSSGTVIDAIGRVGEDPGSVWGTEPVTTGEHTLRRKVEISGGDIDPFDPFDPAVEWDGFPQDTFDGLGTHANGCPVTGPVDSDGDGVSDTDEVIAGTDPGNSNDFFAVVEVEITNGNALVTVPTKTNRTYQVQFTGDPGDTNSWQNLGSPFTGSGGQDTVTDTAPTNEVLFYRGDVRVP